jgi:hypothetical protein
MVEFSIIILVQQSRSGLSDLRSRVPARDKGAGLKGLQL